MKAITPYLKRKTGLSLIEFLIVVSLLGIFLIFSITLYSQHVVRSRRLEAVMTINSLAIALEAYELEHDSYEGFTLPAIFTQNQHYQFNVEINPTGYLIEAMPIGTQASADNGCGTLMLDAKGEKKIGGSKSVSDCW